MKNPKNYLKFIMQRVVLVSLSLALQLLVLGIGIVTAAETYRAVTICLQLIAFAVVLYIISTSKANGAYKLAWIIPILLLPVLGVSLYLLFGGKRLGRSIRQKMQTVSRLTRSELKQDPAVLSALRRQDPDSGKLAQYLLSQNGHPVYADCPTCYYSPVEDAFAQICAALESAEHAIFLEYFIVSPGDMWDTMLEILERKAKAGVEILMLYDDFGCIRHLPMRYAKTLREKGIRAAAFNPYIPILTSRLNNRDHRKLLIIDGKTAFTGGFNLADEYINRKERFGHWRDNALRVTGPAAWAMAVQFLTMWKGVTGEDCNFNRYRPPFPEREACPGFVQAFSDSPLDDEQVGENVYLSVIQSAKKSLQIMTPYLVIDEALSTALQSAAKSGVCVEIYTPGIPDKGYIQLLSRAYYGSLAAAGVKIYEYTPGFLHSKVMLADGKTAVVGTINLDFRSLFLHYENAVVLYGTGSVQQVAADFADLHEKSEEYTLERIRSVKPLTVFARALLRVLAPLM